MNSTDGSTATNNSDSAPQENSSSNTNTNTSTREINTGGVRPSDFVNDLDEMD